MSKNTEMSKVVLKGYATKGWRDADWKKWACSDTYQPWLTNFKFDKSDKKIRITIEEYN